MEYRFVYNLTHLGMMSVVEWLNEMTTMDMNTDTAPIIITNK